MGSASSPAWVDLYTDAFTTARVLAAESAKSTVIVEAYQHLIASPEWNALYGRLRVAHLYGDANVLADLISRARWAEFRQLCAMLGVRPQLVATPAGVSDLYRAVIRCLRERTHLGSTSRGVFNHHLLGRDQPIPQGAASVEPHQREPGEPEAAHDLPTSSALRARPTVTSTTLGSHNISMDGRPLAHPPGSTSSAPTPPGFAELLYAQLRLAPFPSGPATPLVDCHSTPGQRPTLAPLASGHAAECLYKALTATSSSPTFQATPPTSSGPSAEVSSSGASLRPVGAREPSSKRRLYDPGPRRQVGDLQLPPAPPWVKAQSSGLALASSEYSRLRALALAEGGEPGMAIRTELTEAMTITAAIDETIFFGINANTLDMDVRAWDAWERVCRSQGTSPLRTAAEARDFPERNAHLLACLLLHAFSTGRPRDRRRTFIKPRSALAYPLAIVRIFARWGVTMPGQKMLKAAVAGLSRAYLAYYGPMSLAPKRAEPMKFSMVREHYGIPSNNDSCVRIGNQRWSDADHNVFIFRRLICVMMVTAFRLGEIVSHASGEIMFLTFESLTWVIGGIAISHPTAAQLASMRPGIDGARLAPPRSKPTRLRAPSGRNTKEATAHSGRPLGRPAPGAANSSKGFGPARGRAGCTRTTRRNPIARHRACTS